MPTGRDSEERWDADIATGKVSVLMPTYNQQEYVEAAISGILKQQAEPFELLICDDCSVDSTWERVQEALAGYAGKHQVRLMRNKKNLGVNANLNHMIEIASGEILIAAAGDDISTPDRVTRIVEVFSRDKPLLVFSDFHPITASDQIYDGRFDDLIFTHTRDPIDIAGSVALFVGATAAWHRDLFRIFGPLPDAPIYEDLVLGFRAALANRVVMIDEPLVCYRIGIGVSFENPLRKSRVDWIEYRKNTLSRNHATFRQRRKDALAFGLGPESAVVCALDRHLSNTKVRMDAVTFSTLDFLKIYWRRPFPALRVLWSERRRAQKFLGLLT